MACNQPSYHEKLLHWIWATNHFGRHRLQTVSGQEVQIHQLGRHNKTDGPDFKGAEITNGNLRWYGDVEIHWKLSDWRAHGQPPRPIIPDIASNRRLWDYGISIIPLSNNGYGKTPKCSGIIL